MASIVDVDFWHCTVAETYTMRVGKQRRIALDDGFSVILDTSARIRVAFTDWQRRIELVKGRTYFEVATDSLRPLLVRAGDRQVIAIGTVFDLSRHEDQLTVVLIEGHVAVQPVTDSPQPATRMMSPGDRIVFEQAGEVARDQPNLVQVTAWQTGRAVFDDQPFTEAAAEMNRHGRRPPVIADEALAAKGISGVCSTVDTGALARSVSVLLKKRETSYAIVICT